MRKARTDIFKSFFRSEKAGGFMLLFCTVVSLIIANSPVAGSYNNMWHHGFDLSFLGLKEYYNLADLINDGLMTVFFLLVGLEIDRELYIGELSKFRNAVLPVIAAIGGMAVPALIHYGFNAGTPTQAGFGIPMATDIAFSLGILSLTGKRIPLSLKIFLTAFAIIDDLGVIVIIAIFYTKEFSPGYFIASLVIYLAMFYAGKRKITSLVFFITGGIIMWYSMLRSGVHPTIAGVLLAFAIPFHKDDDKNVSYQVQQSLHYPVAFIILPLFALANTAITIPGDIAASLGTGNSLGIMLGLIAGKFAGIFFFSLVAVKSGLARVSSDLSWRYIAGISLLGGIGFTMSIFITNLAFSEESVITASKLSILIASVVAAVGGFLVLRKK